MEPIDVQDHKYMNIIEFRERGYLQEANRRFFHPLGLALEVVCEEDGSERLGGIWDSRDDPEGILFDSYNRDSAKRVEGELVNKVAVRAKMSECDAKGIQIHPEVWSAIPVDPLKDKHYEG